MTGVYYDLKQDKDFDEADYPLVRDNYSLKVIQVVEAKDGSIFLYVYKPSGDTTDIVATKVLMSNTGTNDGLAYYDLELLSAEGVFHKYLIKDLTRLEEYERKYLIISVFRAWNEDYGDTTQDGTIGVEKSYPVEVIFTYKTAVDGTVTLSAEYTEDIITVIDECAGDILYKFPNATGEVTGYMCHYYAFSTNKPIEAIHKAYIEFDYDYHYYLYTGPFSKTEKDEERSETVTLTKEDMVTLPTGDFWFEFWKHYEYDYPRINSTTDFLNQEGNDLTAEAENAIAQQEWILRFYISDYNNISNSSTVYQQWSKIKAIRLFRLEYEYNGKIYDVGVIADTVTSDDVLDGTGGSISKFPLEAEDEEWWQKLLSVLLFVLLIVIIIALFPVLAPIFKFALLGLFHILSALWTILTYPFILIFKNAFK